MYVCIYIYIYIYIFVDLLIYLSHLSSDARPHLAPAHGEDAAPRSVGGSTQHSGGAEVTSGSACPLRGHGSEGERREASRREVTSAPGTARSRCSLYSHSLCLCRSLRRSPPNPSDRKSRGSFLRRATDLTFAEEVVYIYIYIYI